MSKELSESEKIILVIVMILISVIFIFSRIDDIRGIGERQKEHLKEKRYYVVKNKINDIEHSIAILSSFYYTYNIDIIAKQYRQIKNNKNITQKIQLNEKGDFYETPYFLIGKNYTTVEKSGKDIIELSFSFNNTEKYSVEFKDQICKSIFSDLLKSEKIYGIKNKDNIYKFLESPKSYCDKIFYNDTVIGIK